MIPGKASADGTAAFAKGRPGCHAGHWRNALGLTVSSLGMGTYLGNADPVTDGKYAAAVLKSLVLGINVFDSAINYRYQRSERSVGAGLKKAIEAGTVTRDHVLLCTKGGFIAGELEPPTKEWFEETFVKTGIITAGEEIVAGGHCMSPKYLKFGVEQSRKNLGVETIDVFYVHNPETQIPVVGPAEFYRRLTEAFRALEECAAEGKIQFYGTATWQAYRVPETDPSFVSLAETLKCAEAAGGPGHRFKAVQFPANLGLPEAYRLETQPRGETLVPAARAASEAGLAVFTSVPLMQSQLLGRFSPSFKTRFTGLKTDAQRCLQFARSVPGITAPLCGTKDVEHVEENARVAAVPPLTPDEVEGFWTRPPAPT